MNGVPYIMFNDTYYKELNPTADFFNTDEEALELLNSYLDTDKRNLQANKSLDYVRKHLVYKNEIVKMSEYMNSLLSQQKVMGNSNKLNEIIGWIKDNKSITKQEIMQNLNWGRGIKWTPYRSALMNHTNIYDVNDSIPTYTWKK